MYEFACSALIAVGVLASTAAMSLSLCKQMDMRHSCGKARLLSQSFLCRPFSLSSCYQSLASCSSLTSLTINLPGDQLLQVDHEPLGQLTSLSKLTLCYQVRVEGPLWQVEITGLVRLTNLRWLTVKGFVPPASEEQQQQQRCLPASLTSLIIEGAQQLDEEEAHDAIELWLQHAAGCGDLQQLQLVYLYSGDEGLRSLDFGGFAHLKELRFLNLPSPETSSAGTLLPASITQLTDLEVLWLETLSSSKFWTYHFFWGLGTADMDLLVAISEQCPMLQQLGPLCDWESEWDNPNVLGPQPFKHLSHLVLQEGTPHWLDHTRCPSLMNLTIEVHSYVADELLRQLAQLTGLTCLQLNAAFAYVVKAIKPDEGWAQLDRLAAALGNLQRLELVNHFSVPATPQRRFPPLSMPRLSAFTHLKQLRLACAVNHDHPLPEQLTAADLLRGLSGLTQLEQLELIGYVAVTPAVVCALIERLPKLLVLEVRRCDHPEVQVAPAGDGVLGLVAAGLLSGYKEVQELYNQLRPKLRLEVLS